MNYDDILGRFPCTLGNPVHRDQRTLVQLTRELEDAKRQLEAERAAHAETIRQCTEALQPLIDGNHKFSSIWVSSEQVSRIRETWTRMIGVDNR